MGFSPCGPHFPGHKHSLSSAKQRQNGIHGASVGTASNALKWPQDMRRVYLDNNASTPVLAVVFEAMRPYFGERFGNASSIHHHGQETRAAVERARESVAALMGCKSFEVVLYS